MSSLKIAIKRTPYEIGLDGYIYNINSLKRLTSQITRSGTVSTRLYYPPQILKDTYRGRVRHKNEYKVVSNARLLINTLFSVSFKYKILYKDGDKTNCALDNLVLKQTVKNGTHYSDSGERIDLSVFIPLIESRINKIPYEKILLYVD